MTATAGAPSGVHSPDGQVAEVAGDPFTPVETGSAIALGVISLLIAGLLPLLLSALAEEHRLSAAGIGLAAMLEALSTGLVTGLAGIVLKPRRLRLVAAVATLLLIAADVATVRASGSGVFLVRTLAGVPEGLMLWIAIGLISRTQTPERWAAVLFTGMGITQLGVATGLSALILPRFGANGGYVTLACATALALPLCLFLPRSLGAAPGSEGSGGGAPPLRGWVALAGTLSFAASLTAVSVYILPLARQAGLSVAVGRTAISVGLGCQILGGVLATVLAGRVRYITIFWICALAFLTTWATYAVSAPAGAFVAVTGMAGLCGMLAGPFLVPMTIEADPSRRAAMQSGAVQLLAGALGPLLASFVVGDRNVHGVLVLGAGLLLLGLSVVTVLHRLAVVDRARALG
ncbi:MAG: putative transporter [Phenylobacterium sp.]|nr:putative transporter [Phenylobacterium sp.]